MNSLRGVSGGAIRPLFCTLYLAALLRPIRHFVSVYRNGVSPCGHPTCRPPPRNEPAVLWLPPPAFFTRSTGLRTPEAE